MNINNSKLDFKCVELLKKQHQFKIIDIDLTSTFNSLKKLIKIKSKLTLSNLKARLRMATLYSVANENTLLVAGTGNADELYMGYFTKYGDGACDILPIANLTKSEVKLFAEELKVPQIIIDRPPSASLFEGQTDEKEMGVTYKEIDDFLNNKKISNESRSIIKSYHSKNLHKQNLPVKPIF
jgi:NAD+ synthase